MRRCRPLLSEYTSNWLHSAGRLPSHATRAVRHEPGGEKNIHIVVFFEPGIDKREIKVASLANFTNSFLAQLANSMKTVHA